ncbi:MAG: hypothetical protein MUQ27_13085 [Acidimicrobiia bacterium]|nr:hypothetical protein [Acidimicrobiia bacterium]
MRFFNRSALLALVTVLMALSVPAPARAADQITPEQSSNGTWARVIASSSSVTLEATAAGTPYYVWNLNDTVAYGIGSQPVGTFQRTAKVSLNGWKATVPITSDVLTGPAIKATHEWHCSEANALLPSTDCVDTPGSKTNSVATTGKFSTSTYTLHGNHDDVFHWELYWGWTTPTHPGLLWFIGPANSPSYECRNAWVDKCHFG